MSKPNDREPAFPSVGEGFGDPNYSAPGLTKREWLAGQVAPGVLGNPQLMLACTMDLERTKDDLADSVARTALAITDALLRALEKPPL